MAKEWKKMDTEIKKSFIEGYDGLTSKASYIRTFIEKNSDHYFSQKYLEWLLRGKHIMKKSPIPGDYKSMDNGRLFNYHEDLMRNVKELGFEYITEAVAKMHKKGMTALAIGEALGKSDSWTSAIIRYIGLKPGQHGGRRVKTLGGEV